MYKIAELYTLPQQLCEQNALSKWAPMEGRQVPPIVIEAHTKFIGHTR